MVARRRGGLSKELMDHYKSGVYRALSDAVIRAAEGRCQVCDGQATECHHRSYKRIKTQAERWDLIATCRKCHRVLDARRRRQAMPK